MDARAIVAALVATLSKVAAEMHGPAEVPAFFARASAAAAEQLRSA